jgi:hypothetical protein
MAFPGFSSLELPSPTAAEASTTTRPPAVLGPTRNVLGPLTTTFTPPPACSSCFLDDAQSGADSRLDYYIWLCDAYRTAPVCGRPGSSLQECVPSVTSGLDPASLLASELAGALTTTAGFYSPGLVCPDNWVTATSVAWTSDLDSAFGSLQTLLASETAAICCPS